MTARAHRQIRMCASPERPGRYYRRTTPDRLSCRGALPAVSRSRCWKAERSHGPGMTGYAYWIRLLTELILSYWPILVASEPHPSSPNRMHRGQAGYWIVTF
jgi:hypothetical protein